MICVNQALCEGCGICAEVCPTQAITVVNGHAVGDPALCDGCGSFDAIHERACIAVCPNKALTWVSDPILESLSKAPSLIPVLAQGAVVPATTRAAAPWQRVVLPAVGSALVWVGRQVVPRLAPLALDVLDSALDWRVNRWRSDENVAPAFTKQGRDCRKQQRHRYRRGRS